jgi:CRP-like cAMP-binding protein
MSADAFRRNAILANLPESEFERIHHRLELVDTKIRQQIYQPGQPITEVYFPLASVFSVVGHTDKKDIGIEIATVGWEGMVGLPLFLGAGSSPHATFCQIPGPAARLNADDLRHALTADGALHHQLNRFTQATMVQIAQNVVCNSTHAADQRAARWLLTTQDRVGTDEFPLTQEFWAQMLGVRRSTVSETAGRLQSAGLIRYARGIITITDRAGLERTTCHCYRIVKAEFDHLPGR